MSKTRGSPTLAIEVRGLRKSYGKTEAVRGVDLHVSKGGVFALLGPNGAGKTTIVEILEGHRDRTAGEVSVLGYDPGRGERALKQRIGIVLQSTGVEPYLSVEETIDLFRGPWLTALLICIAACSGQSLSPPERLSIGEYGSGAHSRLEWHSSNHGSVSFELEWRFADVPHWLPLATTSPETTAYNGRPTIAEWNFTTCCYRGRAVLGDAESEWSDEVCDFMGAGEPHPPPFWPGSPFDVVAEAMEEGVWLTWAVQDLGEFGQPQSQILRRESTSGKYTVISELPFATFKSYDHDRRYGTFEFIDSEGSRVYCYRIATSLEDRGGRSISGDVCLP